MPSFRIGYTDEMVDCMMSLSMCARLSASSMPNAVVFAADVVSFAPFMKLSNALWNGNFFLQAINWFA